MATNLVKLKTNLVGLHSDSHAIFKRLCFWQIFALGKLKTCNSTITITLDLKLERVVKHDEEFPLLKFYDPWIT